AVLAVQVYEGDQGRQAHARRASAPDPEDRVPPGRPPIAWKGDALVPWHLAPDLGVTADLQHDRRAVQHALVSAEQESQPRDQDLALRPCRVPAERLRGAHREHLTRGAVSV